MQANSSLLVATTNAIKIKMYDVPFIGIEPAIKPAATNSKTQTIGILATQGTLTSELFYETTKSLKHKNYRQVGHGLAAY
jgi:glutamate racemase